MTVDESTYDEDDGNTTDDDHPVTWCTDFDGGRAWYTALGHTQASFTEAPFRRRCSAASRPPRAPSPPTAARRARRPRSASDFEITALDDDTESPMELAVAKDGRVLYVERITGEVNLIKANGDVVTAGRIPVSSVQENGLPGHRPGPELRHQPATSTSPTRRCRTPRRDPRQPLHGHRRHVRPQLRARRSSSSTTSARSAATPPARWPSAWTATSTCRPATTPTRSPRTASTRSTSARAARSGTPSARRPTPTPTAARSCASAARRTRRAPGSARATRSRPATSSTRRRTRPTRPCPRSSRWASATRSGSRSTRTRARC